ncbi:YkgJ family cysteine cluster protein [Nitrosophilus kaiyonis]|uniref:YkgJ family cysteine cluster protein n=1 Tax=Nitrosophilus kaiyonis TaxID=2930200 RepID=UPI0024937DAC|nr:YkgJ family cysteine cluster protein [Nitrosophilus kaiyonis]
MCNIIKKEGFDFSFDQNACYSCDGNCCTGESGYIWLNSDEIESIAKFLKIKSEDFIRNYLKKVRYRYTIKEVVIEGKYNCLFFDPKTKRCEIYPVRPKQCRTFPFWEKYRNPKNIEEVKRECPGIITK